MWIEKKWRGWTASLLVTLPIMDHILEKNVILICVYYGVDTCVVKNLTKRKAIKYCAKYGRKKNTYASSSSFGVPVVGSYDIVSRFNII